jgi:hypothetical protein
MATQFAFGKIVTDGLVLALDASDRNSYPGTGATWYNLVGNTTGTLTNGPTFSSDNGGTLVFDGTDDIVIGYNNILPNTSTCTLEMVVNINTISTYGQLFYIGNSSFNHNIPYVCFCTLITPNRFCFSTNKTAGGSRLVHLVSTSNFTTGSWHHCVGTMGDGLLKMYIDNVYIGSYTLPVDYVADLAGYSTYIGGGLSTGFVTDVNCRIGLARSYNRVLTATEIQQNYNAQKSRFGLS